MAGPLDLVEGSRDLLELSLPGELVVSHPWVVANNIQVDLLHSSPLPAELGDNLPVRGDGDTKLKVRCILGQARSMVRSLPLGRCMVWLAFLEEESKSTVAFFAVEIEGLGGSCTGNLHGSDLGKVGLKLQFLARGVPGR